MTATLHHVFFLGGSAGAGKSAVARRVAAALGLARYSCDDAFADHRRRADPARHPTFHRLMDAPMAELWLQPPETQAADLLAFYRDEWGMVADDLAAHAGPVLAEG